ncbi:hypothetical protein GE09DRAFT_1230544 [Coniochaeta sp. 2T2.1]|nr:hypothetical protein GE09DRAFT_1230544 [Coniochaeta sp. 2T2.1]
MPRTPVAAVPGPPTPTSIVPVKRTREDTGDGADDRQPTPKRSKPSPNSKGAKALDPEGDAVIVLDNHKTGFQEKYLVSSKILSLASPVFTKMFSQKFSEGAKVRNGEVPSIDLEEDDAEMMGIILNILHYRLEDIPRDIETLPLAILAMLSDKYDCKRALGGWIETWFTSQKFNACFSTGTPLGIGYALLAAYKFHCKLSFLSGLASRASKCLPHNFYTQCYKDGLTDLLPEDLEDALIVHIDEAMHRRFATLHGVEEQLQEKSKGFQLSPPGAHLPSLRQDYRVAAYFPLLRKAGLYPHSEQVEGLSVDQVFRKIEGMAKDSGHRCQGGQKCPLKVALKKVLDEALVIRTVVDFKWTWK